MDKLGVKSGAMNEGKYLTRTKLKSIYHSLLLWAKVAFY